jgi:hypothetical protein
VPLLSKLCKKNANARQKITWKTVAEKTVAEKTTGINKRLYIQ